MGRRRRWYSNTAQVCTVVVLLVALLMMIQVKLARSDINKDKEECAKPLAGLAMCLPYVGGQAKAPTQDCCTGLQQVLKDSKKCLCILIKDRNDPSLGFKIDPTLAITLPQTCHAPGPANVSKCPEILHLAPNDPDVKVFTDFAKTAGTTTSATTTTTTTTPTTTDSGTGGGRSAKLTSDGGKDSKGLMFRVLYGVLLCCSVVFYDVLF